MHKKAINIIACEETYKNLSTFKSIEDLNNTVRYYKEKFADKLTRNMVRVLDQLHRYSAKYIGVSFRTKNHIAETLNISRKTVQRACKVLEDLGIIKQLEMKRRSDMRQTSNAIVIIKHEDVQQDTVIDTSECPTKKTTPILKQNIIKERKEPLSVEFVSNKVPRDFFKFASNFFHCAHEIEEFWKVIKLQTRYYLHYSDYDRISLGIDAMKQLVRNLKKGKKVKSLFGYYWGIVNGIMDNEYDAVIKELLTET